MNIHEFQAKEYFKKHGIPIHEGRVATTPDEAFEAAQELARPGYNFAVKAQIHAGGRGKVGGVVVVDTAEEVREHAKKLIGKVLVTKQTGPDGKPCDYLMIEATTPLDKEFYVSVVLDRQVNKPCLIVSEAGGINIEEVAEKNPELIHTRHFSLDDGLLEEEAEKLAAEFVKDKSQAAVFSKTFHAMAEIFLETDAQLIEINPLSIKKNGEVVAIDAKIVIDDNALYRHPEIADLRDVRQEDPREVEAREYDLSYVGLDGNIGCIVNGAGLAMATMDIIKYAGGEPANFLDVGGGASKEKVAGAFKIILRDPKVKAILVNIFGGIMRCDIVAEGVLSAVEEVGVKVPLVVRLEGTNVDQGKAILAKSNLNIITANEFAEAAEKVVASIK